MVSINAGSLRASTAALPLVRVPAGSTSECLVVGEAPFALGVHWVDRSLVCVGDECPLCDFGPKRVLVFLAVRYLVGGKIGRVGLLEMSFGSFARLQGLAEMEGLGVGPGLLLQLSRLKRNSGLIAEPVNQSEWAVNEPFSRGSLLSAISVLLRLPAPDPGEDSVDWAVRLKPLFLKRAIDAMNGLS